MRVLGLSRYGGQVGEVSHDGCCAGGMDDAAGRWRGRVSVGLLAGPMIRLV